MKRSAALWLVAAWLASGCDAADFSGSAAAGEKRAPKLTEKDARSGDAPAPVIEAAATPAGARRSDVVLDGAANQAAGSNPDPFPGKGTGDAIAVSGDPDLFPAGSSGSDDAEPASGSAESASGSGSGDAPQASGRGGADVASGSGASASSSGSSDVPQCPTAADAEVAHALTQANIKTMIHTLDLHVFLYDDGVAEFFPHVDTQPEFKAWSARAIALQNGSDFPFKDAWCREYGLFSADAATATLRFASAGADGVFGDADDLPGIWVGRDD